MCPICLTLLLVGGVVALSYIYLVWNFGYWRKRGIKEAKSYPLFGSLPSQYTQKRNVIYDINDIYRQYKSTENFVGIINGCTPQLLILSPEYAHKVYVNDFKSFHDNVFSQFVNKKRDKILANNPFVLTGESWKERRAEITPGLTSNRVAAVYPVSLQVCKSFSKYIKTQLKMSTKNGIDTKPLCLRYTTEVVSDCVLGIKANSFTDNPTPIFGMIKRVFDQSFWFILSAAIANTIPLIRKMYIPRFFAEDVEKFFVDLMETSIDLRRKMPNSAQRVDFLNYILQLQEKKHLNTMELTAHTLTFLTDGFETTATVLTHLLLLIARNPEVQEKLRFEIGTEELSFDQLSELPYLDACIHEALRVFPALLQGVKLCNEPIELVNKDGTVLKVEPGTQVVVSAYSIQQDPDIFEEPNEFKPERFLIENGGVKKYRDMGVYFGFGDGPRVCLGMRFALTQIKAAVVKLVRDFNIKVNPKTRKDNELDDTYFMSYLKGGVWLDFEERN